MKDLIIVGAGSAARDYLQFVKDVNASLPEPRWSIKGFIADSGVDVENLTCDDFLLLGTIDGWIPSGNEEFVVGVADPHAKRIVVEKLLKKGAHFATLIHPYASVNDYAVIGEGCIVCPFCKVGANARIGNFVTVDGYVEHDNLIGDFVTLSTGTRLAGYVSVGAGTFFGAMCAVKPHTRIGENCFITIGSTVIQDLPDNSYAKGTPGIMVTANRKIDGGGYNCRVKFARPCPLPVLRRAA